MAIFNMGQIKMEIPPEDLALNMTMGTAATAPDQIPFEVKHNSVVRIFFQFN